MMHRGRSYSVADVPDLDTMADRLHGHTWTGCTGWRCGELVALNDSTCADGAQEYGILVGARVEDGDLVGEQVESLTVSWMDRGKLLDVLTRLAAGDWWPDGPREPVRVALHAPGEACGHCR